MSSVIYSYKNDLYLNLTNRCPCRCDFCIRGQAEGVGTADTLWLDSDPTPSEVIRQLDEWNLSNFDEIVFCGYGEPFCALDNMLEVCRHLRTVTDKPLRVNTNGLGDLINQKETAPLLKGLIDTVSISLNAPDPEKYDALCHPDFGPDSYRAMLRFADACKAYVPHVKLSVVDVISTADIEDCKVVAADLKLPLRVRHFSE